VDIREYTTYSDKSPVTGYGVWVVVEEGRRSLLLHPVHLTELVVSEYEFSTGSGNTLWPINSSRGTFDANRFIESFKKRIAFFAENERPFPIHTVAKAYAGFEDISLEDAMAVIRTLSVSELSGSDGLIPKGADKATRVYKVPEKLDLSLFNGRPLVILQELRTNGPSSVHRIVSLVDGKMKTKTDVRRVVTFFVNKLTAQGILEIVT